MKLRSHGRKCASLEPYCQAACALRRARLNVTGLDDMALAQARLIPRGGVSMCRARRSSDSWRCQPPSDKSASLLEGEADVELVPLCAVPPSAASSSDCAALSTQARSASNQQVEN